MSHVHTRSTIEPAPIAAQGQGGRLQLSPPWLRELPSEVASNDGPMVERGFTLRQRASLHLLWVFFRVCYFAGWTAANRASKEMPHARMDEVQGARQ